MHESANDAPAAAAAAIAPVELDTLVPCAPAAAFDYFTRDIGIWWPLALHSCGGERATGVAFEGGEGGALVETESDGTRHVWGTVLAWEPGRRLAFTWHPGYAPESSTSIVVTFRRAGDGTRVRLVHSGWGRLGARAQATRDGYAEGWPGVVQRCYADHCSRGA